ncbi:hypothetical protein CBL_13734 [Carabus blaptoides fortunei]
MDQPIENEISLRGRIACLENDIANLQTILVGAKENLQNSRATYFVLEKKVAYLETERNQILIKIDCQQNTIADMKRDIIQYNRECLKLKIKLKHTESIMGEMISPILLAAIAKKVESVNLPIVLEERLPVELQKNMGLEMEASTSSSARTETSMSSQHSTSRTSN